MKKMLSLCTVMFSGLILIACSRVNTVHAGDDVPPAGNVQYQHGLNGHSAVGTLMKVDVASNTFIIRLANGLDQTFRLEDAAAVNRMDAGSEARTSPTKNSRIRSLSGKEGAQVTVEWEEGPKVAMSLELKSK